MAGLGARNLKLSLSLLFLTEHLVQADRMVRLLEDAWGSFQGSRFFVGVKGSGVRVWGSGKRVWECVF